MGRVTGILRVILVALAVCALAAPVEAASGWTLKATPSHATVEQKATVVLTGSNPPGPPVLVVVEDGSTLHFPFRRVASGQYVATASLLVTGRLTLTAKAGGQTLASTTVTVVPHAGGSSLRILAGIILVGFVMWFWYRSRSLTSSR
jgi:hypothetical protein